MIHTIRWWFITSLTLGLLGRVLADEKLFSGPQLGEKLSPFKVRGVFDDAAGVELDFVSKANGQPIVLIFVHDVNRQSISMTRILSQYTHSRVKDGLATGIVWLDDDATEAETMLNRIRHALTSQAPIGISIDGREGPGSYGLNRNVMLTILIGKEGKVTGNFALVQPSLQADLPKILESIVAVAGGTVPKLEELEGMRDIMKMAKRDPQESSKDKDKVPNLRPLLAPLIQKTATDEAVDKAAKALEAFIEKDEAAKKEIGRITTTIINAGKLENYGTAHAQGYLQRWAKAYGNASQGKTEKGAEAKDQR
jgi:hypothetical protein